MSSIIIEAPLVAASIILCKVLQLSRETAAGEATRAEVCSVASPILQMFFLST